MILPGLYLGSVIDSRDWEQLKRNRITHAVSVHQSPEPKLQELTYLCVSLPDSPEADILQHFKQCISFIHCSRLSGGNCLVHCSAGVSRSATIVTAYIMTVTRLNWAQALAVVSAARPSANPNTGFRKQLQNFGGGGAQEFYRHLEEKYGKSPFNDEEEAKTVLLRGEERELSLQEGERTESAGGRKRTKSAGGGVRPESAGGRRRTESAGGRGRTESAGGRGRTESAGGRGRTESAEERELSLLQ
ncbi:dual specificity protein phosphatase 15 isoform X2 [Ascaphus truei]|uniref:dual specificity protein phosphatase 15 isoform X2 n=1 Tax=Ascaphus truei TaxID=8439 RepID=UPI003F59439C